MTQNWDRPKDQESNSPPVGEGRYVDSQATTRSRDVQRKLNDGSTRDVRQTWAESFKAEIDFPFDIAKPRILESVAQAMELKVFDEMGILPGRGGRTPHPVNQHSDPMVIGRVKVRKNAYEFQEVSFLIAWFVDTKDI